MNALLRIQVQVAAREAQAQLRALSSSISQVARSTQMMNRSGGRSGASALAGDVKGANTQLTALGRLAQRVNGNVDRTSQGMIQMGKNMQWVGRQINFNFTIPLVLAGRAALKWELDNEQAFTRIRKVYGDTGTDYTNELKLIGNGLDMLSEHYGVQRAQVTQLAADWAAAGLQGAALLEATKNSIDLSILGDYQDLHDVFQQLITIQTAYKLSTGQVKTAIAELNTVENMTAATLPDLVTGIAKAGSSAELAGVDFQHLAAFMAVLTPATGSAANAGNALKTIFSRLAKPTKDVVDTLGEMGINMASSSFQMLNGSQKLELMANKFADLTDAQKAFVAGTVGSRFQVNKFAEIMSALADKTGTYQKVLASISPENTTKNLAGANKEIQTLLNSDPRRLQILTNSIKNLMADAIQPAIPFIITIVGYIRALFQWFNNLDPVVRKIAVGFLLLVSSVGIAAQMIGSFKLLFGTAIEFMIWALGQLGFATETAMEEVVAAVAAGEAGVAAEAAGGSAGILGALVGPWVAIPVIVGAALILFHRQIADGIGKAIEFVKRGFNSLPASIQNALLAVARVVATIIRTIIKWLSYLNPFAKHSPSLVDNVTAGVEAILRQYARLDGVADVFRRAAADLAAFTAATADANAAARETDRAEIRKQVTAVSPQAGPQLDQMFGNIDQLTGMLGPLNDAINTQQGRVDDLKASYDLAAAAVDHFDASLQPLRDTVDQLKQGMDDANQAINDYANTNITGMRAADDAIFSNEMAQKKLRLEIMKMEDAGQSFDDIRDKVAALQGDIETTQATMSDLRQAGAGSDVLGVYQDQLDSLTAQKDGLDQAASNADDLKKQLDDLQRTGEELDLQKSLDFDPLLRQIDQLAHAIPELPFDQIIAGIQGQKDNLAQLTASYDQNKASLDEQEATLKTMQDARDRLKQSYDDENTILGVLKDQYGAIEDQIRQITDAINEAVAAQKTLQPTGGGGGGGGGGGVPFDDLTGEFDPTTLDDSLGNMDETIQKWIDDMKKQFGDININPFHFIMVAWDKLVSWWDATAWPWIQNLGPMIMQNLSDFNIGNLDIGGFKKWFGDIGEQLGRFGELLAPAEEAFGHIVRVVQVLLAPLIVYFKMQFKIYEAIFGAGFRLLFRIVEPIFEAFLRSTRNTFRVLHGIIKLVLDLINGDWGKAWHDVLDIFSAIWDQILNLLKLAVIIVADIVRAVVESVVGVISAVFEAGKSIAQGIWDGIVWVWDKIIGWIKDAINGFINTFKDIFGISSPSSVMKDIGIDIITGMLNGIVQAAVAIWTWFGNLATTILGYFATALTWLWQKGSDIATGIWNGITAAAVAVWNWFANLSGTILGYFGDALTWLYDKGMAIIHGLFDGIGWVAEQVWDWFRAVPGLITGFFSGALDLLYQVGKDIITGIWNGLKEVWKHVSGWFVDIIKDIPSVFKTLLGQSSPSKVMAAIGRNTMQGFHDGLKAGFSGIPGTLASMTNQVTEAMAGAQTAFSASVNAQIATQMGNGAAIKTLTFNGDLSFPNITNADDAEGFIKNLEALAESRS